MPELAKATTGGGGEPPLSKVEIKRFKELAARINGDVHLQAILNTAPAESRQTLYDQIVPWVKFKAKPFEELRFF